jgi:ribulose kinase
MTDAVYVAIDQGGHATRASAYAADGSLEGAAFVSIATQRNAIGHVEHDPEEVVASVGTALAELARIVPPARWAAAGFAVQRSSLACWDAGSGRALELSGDGHAGRPVPPLDYFLIRIERRSGVGLCFGGADIGQRFLPETR